MAEEGDGAFPALCSCIEADIPGAPWFSTERARLLELCRTEKSLLPSKEIIVAGVDEVGRGPLAGPVVACAVVFTIPIFLPGLNDSKKMSEPLRNAIKNAVCKSITYAVGIATPDEIDKLNILQASLLSMKRAVEGLSVAPGFLLVDGNQRIPGLRIPQKTVIKGDSRVYSIAAASVVAKVLRDEMMERLDGKYPVYGFARHKGYGTKDHLEALNRLGPCPVHRRSFAPVRAAEWGAEQMTLL